MMYGIDRFVTRFADEATMSDEQPKKETNILGYEIEVPPPKEKPSIVPEFDHLLPDRSPKRRKEASIFPDFD